jgi:myo-inositol-1(or 4)-monophosphatase
VIYSPASGAVYLASDSSLGAYKITAVEERIHVSDNTRLSDAIAIFGFPYNRAAVQEVLAMVRGVAETARDVKRIGPASLDICKVAEGVCDAYFEKDLKPWDYAAAGLVLEKAGGRFGRMGDFILATNGLVYDEFLQALQRFPSGPTFSQSR